MNYYTTSALVAFLIFAMGLIAVLTCGLNAYENRGSKSGRLMLRAAICVFFWDFGYAWMSLCFNSDFAYVPRAIALLAVTLYMFYILRYVGTIADYPKKKLWIVLSIFLLVSLGAWLKIIQKDAVYFTITPWGYWYNSRMSVARLVQFGSVIAALVQYYIIIRYGIKNAHHERDKAVFRQFIWFGPILFAGYLLDTLMPSLFSIAAVPGSCISAFFSALILFRISQKNKVFGLSKVNVSQYVFEDVHIPVIIANSRGEIMLTNDYACEYLAQNSEGMKLQNISKFFDMGDSEIVNVIGSDRECKLDKTHVKDDFDDLLYTIYFVNDVTAEQAALRSAEDNRRLAEEASTAKSNFLANMSHEIRTPMNAIIGMSEILKDEEGLSEKNNSRVNEINVAANNLLGIINDILDISKIEAGRYELLIDNYELPSLVNDVTSITDARLSSGEVKFEVVIDSTMPHTLKGDALRIREILINIIGNAVKFTKEGCITFKAGWDHNETKPCLSFDVIDSGIGIREDDIDLIFETFSQVDTRKNRSIQGTGLGLAISRNLAVLMGGNITVESVYGEGSTFHITIMQHVDNYKPIGAELADALAKHDYRSVPKNKETEIVKRPDAKILLVDDTKINLTVAKHLLKKYGVTIDTALSGREAIDMVQKTDYDIVFMDHMMPEMDGVEATKYIRELGDKYKDLVVIALTANAISEAREMFIREGLQDFLAKPIDIKALDDIMNKWIPV